MKKLAASLLLFAFLAHAQVDDETQPLSPFVFSDDVDTSLSNVFALTRKFPDASFDSWYLRPTREELEQIVAFYFLKRDLTEYMPEAADCDDIAREFMHVSHVWLRRCSPNLPASITVGMAYVEIDGDYGALFPRSAGAHLKAYHCLNVVWLRDGSWVFVEPQTGCITPVEPLIYEGVVYAFRVDM